MSPPEFRAREESTHDSDYLRALEERIARIEAHLGIPFRRTETPGEEYPQSEIQSPRVAEAPSPGIEARIGEFGLPWIGSIILLLGIIFLMAFTFNLGHQVAGCLLGYGAALGLYLFSRTWRVSIPYIARIMEVSSHLLLYYATVRLHFFSNTPILDPLWTGLLLLLLVTAFQFYVSARRNSALLAGLAILMGLTTALLGDSMPFTLALAAVVAVVATILALRRRWMPLLAGTVPAVYAAHFLWLSNNPLMGHPFQAVEAHQQNMVYLFLCSAVFFIPTLFFKEESPYDPSSVGVLFLNAFGVAAISSINAFLFFGDSYPTLYSALAALFLFFSIAQWLRSRQPFAASVSACFGFMSLSISIYGLAGIPDAFLWLTLQSLLVVSMALWFQSKMLVVMNFFIFLGILGTYLLFSPMSNAVNFGIALVALASARVMNWQQQRLSLRTKSLRNLYLTLALFFVLYALYHAVPRNYVTLSWTAAAVAFFVVSLVLHNIKYRWMAIVTLLITVVYLILVDLARLDLIYRVAAFLVLGLMALLVSFFYTKFKRLLDTKN